MKTLNDGFNSYNFEEVPNKYRRLNDGQALDIFSHEAPTLASLPEDLILRIFSNLSLDTLKKLPFVCKVFKKHVNNDLNIWEPIYKSLFLSNDIKPAEIPYSKYCQSTLVKTDVGDEKLGINPIFLAPRDISFVQGLQNMPLQNYKLLNSSETKSLMSQIDMIKLMWFSQEEHKKNNNTIHHVAQQTVEQTTFDYVNYTDYVISHDSNFKLLINNNPTTFHSEKKSSHLFIYLDKNKDTLYIYNKDIGGELISVKSTSPAFLYSPLRSRSSHISMRVDI